MATMSEPETAVCADWITLAQLSHDPFPVYARLRRECPVPYVPAAGRYFVTRYHEVHTVDHDPDTFTANETGSLMKRAMGHSMLRTDDPEHAVQRSSYGNVLKPKAIKQDWSRRFAEHFERFLAEFIAKGPGACLVRDFAAPYAAENLRTVLGFENATHQDLLRWSQTMIDGTANYGDDPRMWELARRSYDEVNDALDEMTTRLRTEPDGSLISHIVNACRCAHSGSMTSSESRRGSACPCASSTADGEPSRRPTAWRWGTAPSCSPPGHARAGPRAPARNWPVCTDCAQWTMPNGCVRRWTGRGTWCSASASRPRPSSPRGRSCRWTTGSWSTSGCAPRR